MCRRTPAPMPFKSANWFVVTVQGQVHLQDGALILCHSECALSNEGLLEDYLKKVVEWLDQNPREVVTILMGNADRVNVNKYKGPLKRSGIRPYLYQAPKKYMLRKDWPTLGEMISNGSRVVFLLDYGANERRVPFVLNEFNHMWETPFSPVDSTFPCTVDRPETWNKRQAKQRMYIANHNLNTELFSDILVPDLDNIEKTNSVSGPSSLGKMAAECKSMLNRIVLSENV